MHLFHYACVVIILYVPFLNYKNCTTPLEESQAFIKSYWALPKTHLCPVQLMASCKSAHRQDLHFTVKHS